MWFFLTLENSVIVIVSSIVPALITALLGTGLISNLFLDTDTSKALIFLTIDNKNNKTILEIKNIGETTLTNFSLFFESPQMIDKILNNYSTTTIFIPIKNNIILQNGESLDIANLFIEFKIPQISKGDGSVILIDLFTNNLQNFDTKKVKINGVYDQGSSKGFISNDYSILTSLVNYDYFKYKYPLLSEVLKILISISVFILIFIVVIIISIIFLRKIGRNNLKQDFILILLSLRYFLKNYSSNTNFTSNKNRIESIIDIIDKDIELKYKYSLSIGKPFVEALKYDVGSGYQRWILSYNIETETLEYFLFKNDPIVLVLLQDLIVNLNKLRFQKNSSEEQEHIIKYSLTLVTDILNKLKNTKLTSK